MAKADNKYIKELYKFFDDIIFSSQSLQTDQDLTQDHDSSDIEDAMRILDDSDDMEDVNAAPSNDEAPRDAGINDTDVLNNGATFTGLLVGVVVIVGALTFLPALALGPIVEHFLSLETCLDLELTLAHLRSLYQWGGTYASSRRLNDGHGL